MKGKRVLKSRPVLYKRAHARRHLKTCARINNYVCERLIVCIHLVELEPDPRIIPFFVRCSGVCFVQDVNLFLDVVDSKPRCCLEGGMSLEEFLPRKVGEKTVIYGQSQC